jgi:hypothetical protein
MKLADVLMLGECGPDLCLRGSTISVARRE